MKFHTISKGNAEVCTRVHGFSTTLQRVVAARLRNRIYRERRLNILFFDTMCYVYVCTPNSNCLHLYCYKTSRNSYSPGGLVQAKGYSSPGISTRLGRGGER